MAAEDNDTAECELPTLLSRRKGARIKLLGVTAKSTDGAMANEAAATELKT